MSVLEVIPGVYLIRVCRYANVLVIAEEKLTLVDTGFHGCCRAVVRAISNLGRSVGEVGLIIITHNHMDHVGGLPELRQLTRAKVAAHWADINGDYLPSPKLISMAVRVSPFSRYRSFIYAHSDEVDIPLMGGEVFDVLGGLEVIHTPGHTPGSICLFARQKRLLIVGDALRKYHWEIRPPRKRDCFNLTLAMASIRKLAELDFGTICFGHGRPLYGDLRAEVQALVNPHL